MGNPHVLVLPYPAQGHVLPLMELAQSLAKIGLRVTFVNTEVIHKRVVDGLSGDAAFGDQFRMVTIPDGLEPGEDRDAPGKLYESINRSMPQKLEELIQEINKTENDKITCLIADVTLGWAQEVAMKMGVQRVGFNPAAAASAALGFSIPKLIEDGIINEDGTPMKKQMLELSPNMPIMNTADFVWARMGSLAMQKIIFRDMVKNNTYGKLAEWLLCNSTYDLEPGAFNLVPHMVPIGPLLASNRLGNSAGHFWPEDSSCLTWLDQQPDCSVIYIAFGSIAVFNKTQFEELAMGLELTNRPFLWVVRPSVENEANEAYPDGFLERVAVRGKMVTWAAQQKVLSHRSIACFMSHCGWNSVVEGVSSGVPFLCWPYFADQFTNETYISDVWKVGLGFKKDEKGIIGRLEIKDKVERLLGDQEFAERVMDLKGKIMSSIREGVCRPSYTIVASDDDSNKGLKAPLLKSLHYLLIHLSANSMCPVNKGADLNELIMEIGQTGIRVSTKDICRLSNLLFEELCKRFKQLFSAAYHVSEIRVLGQAKLQPDTRTAAEELNLLLRCCLTFLNLLVGQQHLILKNGQILLMILRKLSLLNLTEGGNEKSVISFVQLFSRECLYSDNDRAIYFTEEFVASLSFLEPSDRCIPIVSAILEVFLDELLVHDHLRKYLKLIDSVSSTREMPFMPSCDIDNIGIVIEVMSSHFSVNIPNDQALEDFLNNLSLLHGKNSRVPELSLNAAISLLRNPVMLSAPKFMQAHLISLVCEATCSNMNCENLKPDPRHMDCYLTAFERSVILYTKHMSSVKMDGSPTSGGSSLVGKSMHGENFQPNFESYIQPARRKKLNDLITNLDDSWHSRLQSVFFKTQSDLETSSIAFIKENQCILDFTCRDEILLVVSCMILRTPSDVNNIALRTNGGTSPQDICLLASLLKLMSSSLLQALRLVRRGNVNSSKEYDSIMAIINCFGKFNMDLPIQKSFGEMTETHPQKHKESKLMLMHFLGLLSLSFASGIEFFVKGCLLIIMALMNLFVLEEGNLGALRSLIDQQSDSVSNGPHFSSVQKGAMDQKSSVVVSSKFQKIQTLYSSMASSSSPPVRSNCNGTDEQPESLANGLADSETERDVDIEEETCNGEIFLKTIIGCEKSSEVDDLADFIACKKGKDYNKWLKGRQKYRNWKCEKMAALRREKKRRAWKFMKRR